MRLILFLALHPPDSALLSNQVANERDPRHLPQLPVFLPRFCHAPKYPMQFRPPLLVNDRFVVLGSEHHVVMQAQMSR